MRKSLLLFVLGAVFGFYLNELKPRPESKQNNSNSKVSSPGFDEIEYVENEDDTWPINPTFSESFDLRAGDVIKNVNGKKVESMSETKSLYENFQDVKKITVLRGGELIQLKNKYFQAAYNPLLPSITSVTSRSTGVTDVIISYPSGTPDPKFYFKKIGDCAETHPVQCTFNLKWDESINFTSEKRKQMKFAVNLPEITGYSKDVNVVLQGPQNKLTARY